WQIACPRLDPQPLPPGLVALDSEEGRARRERATAIADLQPLLDAFQAQEKASWCGVASQAIALSVLRGAPVSQSEVFSPEAAAVRTWWRVTLTGMPLGELAQMLRANGAPTRVSYASDLDVDAFRDRLVHNLERAGDLALVNYSREPLGQGRGGHISPVAAWDADSDSFLVLDVNAWRWPPVWVGAADLFAATRAIDEESGRSRGVVLISPPPPAELPELADLCDQLHELVGPVVKTGDQYFWEIERPAVTGIALGSEGAPLRVEVASINGGFGTWSQERTLVDPTDEALRDARLPADALRGLVRLATTAGVAQIARWPVMIPDTHHGWPGLVVRDDVAVRRGDAWWVCLDERSEQLPPEDHRPARAGLACAPVGDPERWWRCQGEGVP
ncbi:MAG TPA: phytochelatin synthase family protein, partial [Myxococcota bacterium]|nr:phytochelatin synthase family protein [Myxococcota bacterium]